MSGAGELAKSSAKAQVEACLQNIQEFDPLLKVVITSMAEQAREDAERCDEAARDGRWLGLLHGMPIALKDNIDTAGVRTTSGSQFFADRVPEQDAPAVRRLRAAGAIPIAKVNLAEFAFGATSQNAHYGGCRNPWDPTRIPGGSSGGSAAAVASGMAVGALGTDTGGSVRLPASICGIVGLRPTFGRVPNRGTTQVSLNFDTVGPMARHAVDVARILTVLEGYDPLDVTSAPEPGDNILQQLDRGVAGLRIGLPERYFFEGLHPEVEAVVRTAVAELAGLGAQVKTIDIDGAEFAQLYAQRIVYPDIASFHAQRMAEAEDRFGADVLARLQLGVEIMGTEYAGAQAWRLGWVRRIERTFEDVDLIITPTVPIPPPRADSSDMIETSHAITTTTYPFSLCNMPAVSVPCGFADGMPVGLHLVGPRWADGLVLRAAAAYQEVTSWHLKRPDLLKSEGTVDA